MFALSVSSSCVSVFSGFRDFFLLLPANIRVCRTRKFGRSLVGVDTGERTIITACSHVIPSFVLFWLVLYSPFYNRACRALDFPRTFDVKRYTFAYKAKGDSSFSLFAWNFSECGASVLVRRIYLSGLMFVTLVKDVDAMRYGFQILSRNAGPLYQDFPWVLVVLTFEECYIFDFNRWKNSYIGLIMASRKRKFCLLLFMSLIVWWRTDYRCFENV